MDINFDKRAVNVFKEISYQTKVIQEICETVVPDTDEDIGSLAAVQSSVLLKSKDLTSRGVLITGEACASVMYVNEAQDKVSYLKLKRAFSMEYDLAESSADITSQINLHIVSAEARLINPRKVSVCFEIAGELCCYVSDDLVVEYGIPKDTSAGIHAKYENTELNIVSSVCEKTFSLSEQLAFPTGKPTPSKIVSADACIAINDTQTVGTKVIVKGNAEIAVNYLSEEVNYPVKTEFTAAFSQIIDIGDKSVESCSIAPAITGIYFNLADSIVGEKILDLELHAVLQLVCRSKCTLAYISDAYSNLMPAVCCREKSSISHVVDYKKIKAGTDERINISEDCADVLSVFVCMSHFNQQQEGISANVNMDIIYRNTGGFIESVRRSVKLECECPAQSFRVNSARLADLYIRPDGQFVECHIAMEMACLICSEIEFDRLVSVSLDEDGKIDFDKYPTVSLVRCSGESVWELAKTYHSSVEQITLSNDMGTDLKGKMILVPKCI